MSERDEARKLLGDVVAWVREKPSAPQGQGVPAKDGLFGWADNLAERSLDTTFTHTEWKKVAAYVAALEAEKEEQVDLVTWWAAKVYALEARVAEGELPVGSFVHRKRDHHGLRSVYEVLTNPFRDEYMEHSHAGPYILIRHIDGPYKNRVDREPVFAFVPVTPESPTGEIEDQPYFEEHDERLGDST